MSKNDEVLVALDIGTTKVVCLVAEKSDDFGLNIKAVGYAPSPSDGLSNGRIINMPKIVRAIEEAVEKASNYSGYDCLSAYIGIAGEHINGIKVHGSVGTNKTSVVNKNDIERVISQAVILNIPSNQQILSQIPMEFRLNGGERIINPINLRGEKLEVFVHVFTVETNCLNDLCQCVDEAGLAIDNVYLESVASAEAVLSNAEKQQGVLLLDIGGGTTGMAIYLNGVIHHVHEIAIGGDSLTCDLATALNISLESAECLKLTHGSCYEDVIPDDYIIEVSSLDNINSVDIGVMSVCQILRRGIENLFQLVNFELIRSGYDEHVRNVVLTGGSSLLMGIRELGLDIFNKQIRVGYPMINGSVDEMLNSPIYSTAVGLILYSQNNLSEFDEHVPRRTNNTGFIGKVKSFFGAR
ncbi:MAG: cell division protein FtsA [Deltaproteobacteria bacterium]|jgi:cell division protein FtsA|nr:cell division protein FtsA [Deltaproteobacteria bacterium]